MCYFQKVNEIIISTWKNICFFCDPQNRKLFTEFIASVYVFILFLLLKSDCFMFMKASRVLEKFHSSVEFQKFSPFVPILLFFFVIGKYRK